MKSVVTIFSCAGKTRDHLNLLSKTELTLPGKPVPEKLTRIKRFSNSEDRERNRGKGIARYFARTRLIMWASYSYYIKNTHINFHMKCFILYAHIGEFTRWFMLCSDVRYAAHWKFFWIYIHFLCLYVHNQPHRYQLLLQNINSK